MTEALAWCRHQEIAAELEAAKTHIKESDRINSESSRGAARGLLATQPLSSKLHSCHRRAADNAAKLGALLAEKASLVQALSLAEKRSGRCVVSLALRRAER
jgi:hypothetical protein